MQHQQQHVLVTAQLVQMRTQRKLAAKIEPATRGRRQRSTQRSLIDSLDRQRQMHRRRRHNLLPRHPDTLREQGPKALVAHHHVVQRTLQRRNRVYATTLAAIEEAERSTMRTATRYLERTMVADIERITGAKGATAMTAVTDCLDWIGTKRVAVATPFRKSQNDYMEKYLTEAGYTVTGGKLMKKLSSEGTGTPEEYERVLKYCMQDVVVEATIGMVVRDLTPDEWQDYWVCERMNDRGIPVDIELARAAQRYAGIEAAEIAAELKQVTKGAVTSAKQFKRIKTWLIEHAPDLMDLLADEEGKVSLDKSARATALESDLDLPRDVEDLLHLIDDAGRASTAKYAAIEARADADGRLRGAYLFNGAGQTGNVLPERAVFYCYFEFLIP